MDLIAHRRRLHQIPELDFRLPETLNYIHSVLDPLPCQVFSPAPGSLCAFFDFGKDTALAFRADMDALPVTEKTGLPFSSCHPGQMHACGHDGHMAIALALAQWAAEQDTLPHNLLLVFQPAEETTGGAKMICDSGVFEAHRTKAIFGLHLWPDLPLGRIATRPGGMMCRSSEVTLAVTGRSAHVARAEMGLDALEAAARWYLGAMEAERSLPGDVPRLLKFGKMQAGTIRNVIAGSATLEGTLRAYEDEVFDALAQRLRQLCHSLEHETGCRFDLHLSEGYPAVWNPEELYEQVSRIYPLSLLEEPVRIAEDFSYYQRRLPGLFLFLGCGPAPALHREDFQFDEGALETGFRLFRRIAEAYP